MSAFETDPRVILEKAKSEGREMATNELAMMMLTIADNLGAKINTVKDDMGTKIDDMGTKIEAVKEDTGHLLLATPEAMKINPKAVVGWENMSVRKKAIISGGGATWTVLERDSKYYAVSSLHCTVRKKHQEEEKGAKGDGKVYIRVPPALQGNVSSVGFVTGNAHRNEDGKRPDALKDCTLVIEGGSKIEHDIAFFQLNSLPAGIEPVSWDDTSCFQANTNFVISPVYGLSHSQTVTGKQAVLKEDKNFYVFLLSEGEKGNSGTLMYGVGSDGNARIVGVFYGVPSQAQLGFAAAQKHGANEISEYIHGGHRVRGAICPMPAFDGITWVNADYESESGDSLPCTIKIKNVVVKRNAPRGMFAGLFNFFHDCE